MLADSFAVLLGIFEKHGVQGRVDRTLAAIQHHGHVKQFPVRIVEFDLVPRHKGIGTNTVGVEIRIHIVLGKAGPADGSGSTAHLVPLVPSLDQRVEMTMHAVVIIKEAVSDKQNGRGGDVIQGLFYRLGGGKNGRGCEQEQDAQHKCAENPWLHSIHSFMK